MKVLVKPDTAGFRLYVVCNGYESVAGDRLIKGGKFPNIEYVCASREQADINAEKLQRYINEEIRK